MAWQAGEQLQGGKYTVEQELGRGRFGITYLAKDRNGDRLVMKILNNNLLNFLFYFFAATTKADSEARAKARAMLESRMRARVMVIAGTTAMAGTLVMNWIWYEHWIIAILLAVAISCVGNSKNDTVVNNLSVAVSGLGGGALLGGFLGVITGNDIFVGSLIGAWTISIAFLLFFAKTEVNEKLQNHFSNLITVLTMTLTSVIGLGLGWLGHWVFWR